MLEHSVLGLCPGRIYTTADFKRMVTGDVNLPVVLEMEILYARKYVFVFVEFFVFY